MNKLFIITQNPTSTKTRIKTIQDIEMLFAEYSQNPTSTKTRIKTDIFSVTATQNSDLRTQLPLKQGLRLSGLSHQ